MFWKKNAFHYKLEDQIPFSIPLKDLNFTVLDTETTGFSVDKNDRLIEIGAVSIHHLEVSHSIFHTYVHPNLEIPEPIVQLTGIHQEKIKDAPPALDAIQSLFSFSEKQQTACMVGHHVEFDLTVLKEELLRENYLFHQPVSMDTVDLIRILYPTLEHRDLEQYALFFNTPIFERHTAIGDSLTTAYLFVELLKQLQARGFKTWGDLIYASDHYHRSVEYQCYI